MNRNHENSVIAATLLVMATTVGAAAQCDLDEYFTSFECLDLGATSILIAAGDLDGDDGTDLVLTLDQQHSFFVMRQNVGGGFDDPVQVSFDQTVHDLQVIDVNDDGLNDIVAGVNAPLGLSVHLNDGKGGFVHVTPDLEVPRIIDLAFGDFNEDGVVDVAVTMDAPDGVGVFLGNGDGSFNVNATPIIEGPFLGCEVGDMNGDGADDFLGWSTSANPNLQGLLGDGSGSFSVGTAFNISAFVRDVRLANIDGDASEEVVVALRDDEVWAFHVDGDGVFGKPIVHQVAEDSPVFHLKDLNGDGAADVVRGRFTEVGVLLANGLGGFHPEQPVLHGQSMINAAVTDIDHDGRQDLVIAGDRLCMILGNDQASLDGFLTSPSGIGTPSGFARADFNLDGISDLAMLNTGNSRIGIVMGAGNGRFEMLNVLNVSEEEVNRIAVDDINGDGRADLLTASKYGFEYRQGIADGFFNDPVLYPIVSQANGITTGDFNGDGLTDAAVADRNGDVISLWFNIGPQIFNERVDIVAPGWPSAIWNADLEGDGDLDLVVIGRDDDVVSILINDGDGNFSAPSSIPFASTPSDVMIADFNMDGGLDLLVMTPAESMVSLLTSNGDGTFTVLQQLVTEAGEHFGETGDINGDGAPDAVIAGDDDELSVAVVLINDGFGHLQATAPVVMPHTVLSMTIEDADLDGSSDLIFTHFPSGVISVLLNQCDFPCGADLDESGVVDINDLLALLGSWGACDDHCPADLNGDGVVGVDDLTALLAAWGDCD